MRGSQVDNCPQGADIGGRTTTNPRYADDTTLVSYTEEGLVEMVNRVKEESEKYGLRLNVAKTKVMATGGLERFKFGARMLK